MPTDSEKLIHVKFDFEEAVQAKKDVLGSQADLLEILKTMKKYESLKALEFKLKTKLHGQIKELLTSLRKLQQTVPRIKIPEILQKTFGEDLEGTDSKKETSKFELKQIKREKYERDIEAQLQDIQEKLRSLG